MIFVRVSSLTYNKFDKRSIPVLTLTLQRAQLFSFLVCLPFTFAVRQRLLRPVIVVFLRRYFHHQFESMESSFDKANDRYTTFSLSPAKFTLISWNVDGLDQNNLAERTVAVVDLLEKRNYTIIMFQELILATYEYISSRLKLKYLPVRGTNNPYSEYFTATFLRINHAAYVDHQIVNFPDTIMNRNLLITRCRIDNIKLVVCNTHSESMAAYASQRMAQLKICFERCLTFAPEWNVIFGGDLNARDNEVRGKVPSNMCDVWIKCGSNSSSKYTWDLALNTNKRMPNKQQPRCRFDRIYYRESVPVSVRPEFFGITGLEKVPGTDSFPSDHWGVAVLFQATS